MKKCHILIKSYFILIICITYFWIIKCDGSDPDLRCPSENCQSDGFECKSKEGKFCNTNCKPNYGTSYCYYCETVSPYYYIDTSSCRHSSCSGGKVIIKS